MRDSASHVLQPLRGELASSGKQTRRRGQVARKDASPFAPDVQPGAHVRIVSGKVIDFDDAVANEAVAEQFGGQQAPGRPGLVLLVTGKFEDVGMVAHREPELSGKRNFADPWPIRSRPCDAQI